MTAYQASFNTTSLYDVSYVRDDLGRITQKTETLDGRTTVHDYQYDLAGRLTQVSENGSLVARYAYVFSASNLSTARQNRT
ncbi:hypothetical protein [Thiohalophilus sp.]|uniref:hypothetical protein n=1 Tax=Thiohalophilus sp. TaxID=3028392 RepID=UPI002ACE5B04|nr:hypothetical protein [Thiohalophilus sp.]MDZ7663686.1 hypothetical protein [Thiohalophilus sp.]